MKILKNTIIIAAIALSIGVFTGCDNSNNAASNAEADVHEEEATEGMAVLGKAQRDALNIKLGTIQNRNMTSTIKTNGRLEVAPSDKAEITTFMGGNVKHINVFHGDKVRKGETLAKLEHPDFIKLQQEYVQVSNQLTYLKKEFDRQKVLYENQVGSGKNFQKVESDYRSTNAQYEGLKLQLEMLNLNPKSIESGKLVREINVVSPISGYVSKIDINLGSYVNAETKMFSISNTDKIHADLLVYEKDIAQLSIGQETRLTIANQPGMELKATIFAIAKEYQSDAKAVVAHATIEDAPANLIEDSYVNGEIFTETKTTKAVPESALVNEEGKNYIFVYDDEATEAAGHDDGHGHGEAEKEDDGHGHGQAKHDDDDDGHAHGDKDDDDDVAHEDEHESDEHGNENWAFRMVEVITGVQDNGFVEITLLESLPANAQVVMDGAFYLLSDLKKGEAEHSH